MLVLVGGGDFWFLKKGAESIEWIRYKAYRLIFWDGCCGCYRADADDPAV